MHLEHQGMTLWYGTPDAPAPEESVHADAEIALNIGIKPADITNKIEVLYRVDQGVIKKVTAEWLRHDVARQAQYFIARFPAFNAGDTVQYTVIGHCAGRQVPSPEEASQFLNGFKIIGTSSQSANTAIDQKSPLPMDTAQANNANEAKGINAPEGVTPTPDQSEGMPSPEQVEGIPSPTPNLESRINIIHSVLDNANHRAIVSEAVKASNGDIPTALNSLKDKLPPASLQKVTLAHSLAVLSDDHIPLVKALAEHPDVNNLRDVALRFNVEKLSKLVDPKAVSESVAGATDEEKKQNFAIALNDKLFAAEPTAVLQRMVQEAEVPIADVNLRSRVANFLANQPDFNIRTTSIYTALKYPEAFKDIAEEHKAGVVDHLKTLQRVQAISPTPKAVSQLMKLNHTSAFRVAEMPESTFLNMHSEGLGEETARQVYTNAINAHIRNEHALITTRETLKGTGLAIIDGQRTKEERLASLQAVTDRNAVQLNLETLFGSIDSCECDDCLSVYSPASYFVEILQYLRNNNLGPDPKTKDKDPDPAHNPNIHPTGFGTPLEKLFRRRPDLFCLELTCQNTFTVLPYIDLVNEVMESFVVHNDVYRNSSPDPNQRQTFLDVFNVDTETTSELLSQPQHINYDAYCILKNAVYPFTLPYHQPIDAIRIFLNYLGTSFYELLDTYRTAKELCPNGITLSDADREELQVLHQIVQDRAVDAEFLGITQEEYIILTKEAFWPKRYFDITKQPQEISDDEYKHNIGVRQVCEYYGYIPSPHYYENYRNQIDVSNNCEYIPSDMGDCNGEMLSKDENPNTGQKGLTFVKKQFLRRTGIQYTDLVELLKTQFINPNYPKGEALNILESIRFSYRFLQLLVNYNATTQNVKYQQLIAFLNNTQIWAQWFENLLHPDPCNPKTVDLCAEKQDFTQWVYCYFEQVGKLIVLESGEGPQLPIEGKICEPSIASGANVCQFVGTLRKDGSIVDEYGGFIGQVGATLGQIDNLPVALAGPINWKDNKFSNVNFMIQDGNSHIIGSINNMGFLTSGTFPIAVGNFLTWLPPRDTCDLEKVRLIHLDGSALTIPEYDRIHRFIRLWRKMGWTIDETDKALIGLGAISGTSAITSDCQYVDFDAFVQIDGSTNGGCNDGTDPSVGWNCPDKALVDYEISPDFLHQLAAVRKLLDLTGLPLIKLLTFWADISTVGEKSLYSKLFLTHNLLAIDSVFQADEHGNYLTQAATITDHIPVLMAALKLKADDITAIMKFHQPKLDDELTLQNVSAIYRHGLLAKILHVRVTDLQDVIALFGDPFKSAVQTLMLLENWGKMEDSGFTFRQLNYIIRNQDDSLRPLAPSLRKILQLTKTLYDGLNAIDQSNPDITDKDDPTADLIRSKAGLLFDQSVVEQIIAFLEGTMVYTTSVLEVLNFTIPATQKTLAQKLKYTNQKDAKPPSAIVQVTGILTADELTQAQALGDSAWKEAIDCIHKQPRNFFDDVLFGIFPDKTDAINNLVTGDINIHPDPNAPHATDLNTAPIKRRYFLQHFMPFLRQQLQHRFIVDTLSGAASLPSDVTDILLSNVLVVGATPQPAISALDNIKAHSAENPTDWKGYLIPSADNNYTFIAINKTPPDPLILDGQSIAFLHKQECPTAWLTDPVPLKNGRLYKFEVPGQHAEWLNWKTSTSPKALIPTSALLPDYSSQGTEEIFTKLYKVALLVNGFNLSADEVIYWQTHGTDFADNTSAKFDFNSVTLGHWQRLQAYTTLRNSLPRVDMTLLDLFRWAASKPDTANAKLLSKEIATVTNWKQENIDKLLKPEHFDLNRPEIFQNEVGLVKLQKALQVADKIAVDIDRLFDWAKPGSQFWMCHQIAEDIRKAIRARYDQTDWEQVVKPLNDQLREHQKLALIAYLLVQPDLIEWRVVDADSLFEFFLIDVQMDACMETSRIKQAISTVQLFIQRCFLGLEDKQDSAGNQIGVPNEALDHDRWEWMQKYRVWEANRKVFLYPENWIASPLRDDKSPFYKELASELLQKDINPQTVQDALKNYLFKVDEVANMKVVGLFVEEGEQGKQLKIHIFSRTRNAPYFFYYRYFDIQESNWYPWEKVQVDIPSYDSEDNNEILENGTYLIPVVWNKRLLIFFPQFMKKTSPNLGDKTFQELRNTKLTDNKPVEYWEIKMAWSEYRNGKWTQKQVSSDAIYYYEVTSIQKFIFVPISISGSTPQLIIDVFPSKAFLHILGEFVFSGNELSKHAPQFPIKIDSNVDFHYFHSVKDIYSLQIANTSTSSGVLAPTFFEKAPSFNSNDKSILLCDGCQKIKFYHFLIHHLLGLLTTSSLDDLFIYFLTITDQTDKDDAYGGYFDTGGKTHLYNELKRPYALYNWESGFHAPMQLVERLLKSQQFDQALKMCHYVFNPLAKGTDDKRFWQFPPFKEVEAENVLESLFLKLQPGQPDSDINEWRDKPFQPHVVARSRPSAYMKWVVMKYIEILIAYGDYYFRQNTLETIPLAIQCYVLASHLYGPRGQKIPKRGKVKPQTYLSLLDKWDAFGNAMVELELAFPFSNQTPFWVGVSNGVVGLANVFGFATTLYFCIPDNPQLMALRDTIDDRLFKIRHCQDIEGVFRQLPLFEPPIDPGLLVQAAAQGLSISSVLNDLNSPMPNYRFNYLLQKALELCSELKALGNAFLSAKEKGDGEALSQLRAKHESTMQNLVMEVKKQQVEEASRSLEALKQSRKGPVSRMNYYLQLIDIDVSNIPDANRDFSDLPNQLEKPVDESGLKLIGYEKEEMDKAAEAAHKQESIGGIEVLAGILHIIPDININTAPIGLGITTTVLHGLGNAAQAWARSEQIVAGNRTFSSTNSGRKAGFLRQLQDRVQQANTAGYEIKNIDKQILTQQIRIAIANQEITNQQQNIDNAQEVEEFLRNKYTNEELYLWMQDSIQTLYHQAYNLAYDLAKKAEKVFRFERGLTTSTTPNFIQFGYWDGAHDGLLSGERLYISLNQLEAAYLEKRGYDYEVTKHVSLRQINPLALINLRETGKCEFALPEVLFDMDRPGDYMRRIKSVALTVPCVVGPYTSLNCTLRILEHEFRLSAIATGYPKKTDETDDRFSTFNVPITSIAVSSGQNDSGVFELNFKDERYIPFEGAGAISKWRLELPDFQQFDYNTISDAIIHIRYTSVEGGDNLKKAAADSVKAYIKGVEELSKEDEGLFAFFDLKHDFSSEWYKAMNPPAGAPERILMLNNLSDRLPIFTKGKKIVATAVYLYKPKTLKSAITLIQSDSTKTDFSSLKDIGEMTLSAIPGGDNTIPMDNWQVKIQGVTPEIEKLWLLVRYVLK